MRTIPLTFVAVAALLIGSGGAGAQTVGGDAAFVPAPQGPYHSTRLQAQPAPNYPPMAGQGERMPDQQGAVEGRQPPRGQAGSGGFPMPFPWPRGFTGGPPPQGTEYAPLSGEGLPKGLEPEGEDKTADKPAGKQAAEAPAAAPQQPQAPAYQQPQAARGYGRHRGRGMPWPTPWGGQAWQPPPYPRYPQAQPQQQPQQPAQSQQPAQGQPQQPAPQQAPAWGYAPGYGPGYGRGYGYGYGRGYGRWQGQGGGQTYAPGYGYPPRYGQAPWPAQPGYPAPQGQPPQAETR